MAEIIQLSFRLGSDQNLKRIEVREGPGNWETTYGSGELCVDDGTFDDRDNNLKLLGVLNGAPRTVMVLKNTGFDGSEGDRGTANCECCGGSCDPSPKWKLVGVE